MIHPVAAHFAVVLPIVASVFGLVYLYTRSEGMSKISTRVLVFATLGMIAAWYTGGLEGPEIYDYLSEEGQHELLEHKALGLYLAIAMGVITVLKFLGCTMKKFALEALAIVLLFGATGATLLQGKHGGEIVYEYGMPFQAYMMQDTLQTGLDDAAEAEDTAEKLDVITEAVKEVLAAEEAEEEEEE